MRIDHNTGVIAAVLMLTVALYAAKTAPEKKALSPEDRRATAIAQLCEVPASVRCGGIVSVHQVNGTTRHYFVERITEDGRDVSYYFTLAGRVNAPVPEECWRLSRLCSFTRPNTDRWREINASFQ